MEALAKGCQKVKGGFCEGIVVLSDLPVESNPYLSETTNAANMFDRLDILNKRADAIVALPGYIGTLNELIMSATLSYITDENKRRKIPIFASRSPWEPIWKCICSELHVWNVALAFILANSSPCTNRSVL